MSTQVGFKEIQTKKTGVFEGGGLRAPGMGAILRSIGDGDDQVLIDGDTHRVRLDIQNEDTTNPVYVHTIPGENDITKMRRIAAGAELIVPALPEGMDRSCQVQWFAKAAPSQTISVRVSSYIT